MADSLIRQHVENMNVRQAGIDKGDTLWYVATANGFAISKGYVDKADAEADLDRRRHNLEAMQSEDS